VRLSLRDPPCVDRAARSVGHSVRVGYWLYRSTTHEACVLVAACACVAALRIVAAQALVPSMGYLVSACTSLDPAAQREAGPP
jgi:hypothetical protein